MNLKENNSKNRDEIRDYWNMRSKGFRNMSRNNIITEDSLLGEVNAERKILDKNTRVLDVGCGAGRYGPYFSKAAGHYTGIDISDQMIEFAQEDYGHLPNVEFKVYDWEDEEDLEGAPFDLVFGAMSAALSSREAIEKFMGYSRKYCLVERFIRGSSSLDQWAMELFGRQIIHRAHNNHQYVLDLLSIIMEHDYTPEMLKRSTSTVEKYTVQEVEDNFHYLWNALSDQEREIFIEEIQRQADNGMVEVEKKSDLVAVLWDVSEE